MFFHVLLINITNTAAVDIVSRCFLLFTLPVCCFIVTGDELSFNS